MGDVLATYRIEGITKDVEKKADAIAIGLTVGSWTDLPLVEQKQLERHKGRVISATLTEENIANVTIAYPTDNFSLDLPAILTTVFGKLSLDGKIKLIDLDFSKDLLTAFPGPKVGLKGIRELVNVHNRPLLMSIFKGLIGRDLTYMKEQMKAQALGGMNLVKDDEILFENELTPLTERIKTCKEALKESYEETGKRTLYAVNLSGKTFHLKEQAYRAVEAGADVFLFNVFSYGLDVMQGLVEDPEISIPIMAHPAYAGALVSSPTYGLAAPLLMGKLLRYAGADFSLFPSPYGSVAMAKEETQLLAKECTVDNGIHLQTFPVPSAGIHPGLVPVLIEDFGIDCIINAGGGIHGHRGGAAAGGKAFVAAIDAVLSNQTLDEAAKGSGELATALEQWGSK